MDKFLDRVGLARLWQNILIKFDTLVGTKPVSQQIEEALENIGSSNIEVDATLSVEGMAADAKAVRDLVEESQITIDTTLTQSGQAADAKVVGDAIAGITLTSLGVTATAAELNKMDGITATTTELNYVDGVTSNIQT